MSRIKGESQTVEQEGVAEPKVRLKHPVSRQQLLEHTEDDPQGAEEFLELLRVARRDRHGPPDLK
jgi:hypothetical protein